MEIELTLFARFAEASQDGTFTMHGGGFNKLAVPAFPAQVPSLYFFVRLKGEMQELDLDHTLRIDISGPETERRPLGATAKMTKEMARKSLAMDGFGMNCTIALLGQTFPAPGRFVFHVVLDDKDVGAATLMLTTPEAEGVGK
jgi:hypothetical protein